MRRGILAALLAVLAAPAAAQNAATFNEWVCVASPGELFDITFDNGTLRVNNISIGDAKSFDTGRSEVKVTYSASNRSDEKAALSVEFAVRGQDPVALALSASPITGAVPPKSTEQVSETTLTPSSAATNEAGDICVRLTD